MKLQEILNSPDYGSGEGELEDVENAVAKGERFLKDLRKKAGAAFELYRLLSEALKMPELLAVAKRIDRRVKELHQIADLVSAALPACREVERLWEAAVRRKAPWADYLRALKASPGFASFKKTIESAVALEREILDFETSNSVFEDFLEIVPEQSPLHETCEYVAERLDPTEISSGLNELVEFVHTCLDEEAYESWVTDD